MTITSTATSALPASAHVHGMHSKDKREKQKRLSLQPPAGLPQIPRSPVGTPLSARFAYQQPGNAGDGGKQGQDGVHSHAATPPDRAAGTGQDQDEDPESLATGARRDSASSASSHDSCSTSAEGEGADENTLMGCMMHLSVSSLPPIPCSSSSLSASKCTGGPLVTRFPAPPKPNPSSTLGTREEQRRVYLGPKLSDRATGGPDAGPLIERFSCLFKDRKFSRLLFRDEIQGGW